jgi:hypothetical protein
LIRLSAVKLRLPAMPRRSLPLKIQAHRLTGALAAVGATGIPTAAPSDRSGTEVVRSDLRPPRRRKSLVARRLKRCRAALLISSAVAAHAVMGRWKVPFARASRTRRACSGEHIRSKSHDYTHSCARGIQGNRVCCHTIVVPGLAAGQTVTILLAHMRAVLSVSGIGFA